MFRRRILLLAAALVSTLTLLSSCRTLPIDGRLPDGLAAEKITSVEEGSPFAVSPDGNVVAMVSSGLKMFHIGFKEQIDLSGDSPEKVAWSPFGSFLAALYRKDGKSTIITYDQHGILVAEAKVDDVLTDLGWLSDDEIYAGGLNIKNYKFGSNYRSIFYRWSPGRGLPVAISLRDTTILPLTFSKWKSLLERGPMTESAGQTAQILYLHPVAPPLFAPYYKLIIRDLETGKELEPVNFNLNSDGGSFSADGETILFGDGNGSVKLFNPWSEETLHTVTTPGKSPVLSPDGATWFADGTLFRNSSMVTPLAPGEARFTPDGSRLLISSGGSLYLVTGLKKAEGSLFVPSLVDKIQKLRSMRVQGLVTPAEYKETLKRITTP
jgi:WD40 repeat protein